MKKQNKKKTVPAASRRSFCKNSALLTAGMVLPAMDMVAMAPNAENKTLKLAVVGCGGRGTGAANQALKADDNVVLVAMADAFQDQVDKSHANLLKAYAGTNRVAVKDKHKYAGMDAYKKAIDQADVVILATPPGFRPYHFEYAINNGKHVFMEKPVATDVPGIRKVLEMARVAKEKKLNVVVASSAIIKIIIWRSPIK